MREMTKILLSACTVCALGQGNAARAQSSQTPDQPPTSPPTDAPPSTPPSEPSGSSPTSPADQPTEPPTPTSPAVPDTNQPSPPSPPESTTTTTTTTTTTADGAAATAAPPPATTTEEAAPGTNTDMWNFEWHNPQLQTGIGVSVLLGGGVAQFRNGTMRDTTSNLGGMWDLHVTIGTHLPLALDVAYVGSATHISTLPTGNTGTLVGTAAEGTLRWNVLPHYAWTPYVFGGVGYQRYDVEGTSVSLSDAGMNDHDNLLSVPAGIGFVWRTTNGFVADIHGTYRFTWFQDLVLKGGAPALNTSSSNFIKMDNWSAGASLGYEF
jgi:hypothetical protein